MTRIALIGSGDFAEQVMNVCEEIDDIQIVGCFDGNKIAGSKVSGYPVIGNDDDVEDCFDRNMFDSLFVCIGYNDFGVKERLFERFQKRIPMARIIHPTSIINHTAVIGKGVLISQGVIIDKSSVIEDDVTVLPGTFISHDCIVGKHSFISARAAVAGRVTIGEKCFVGLNSCLRDGVVVGKEVTIGMGSVVVGDVGDYETVVGNPYRVIKKKPGGVRKSSEIS